MRYIAANLWFNLVWFQLCWFAAVWLQSAEICLAMLALHLYLLPAPWKNLRGVLLCATFGIATDILLTLAGVFQFSSSPVTIIPLWLVALWLCFSATLGYSLSFLGRSVWLAAAAGILGGPFSYFIGSQLNAVTFGFSSVLTLGLLAAVWAVLLPALHKCWYLSQQQPVRGLI